MKHLLSAVAVAVLSGVFLYAPVSALGLKVAPQQYRAMLAEGERKTAFIDVGNPTDEAVKVVVSVQAFRQINDDGGLQFYDDKAIAAAIQPDLRRFTLEPREAARLYFSVDGRLLPEGDVFAAVFFASAPAQPRIGSGQLVRVGTLLSLVNIEPGERRAAVTALEMPLLQFETTIKGSYTIRNTSEKDSGFYPEVIISAWPDGPRQPNQSSLVFSGRERENTFSYELSPGVHRVQATYGDSGQSRWVIVLPPWLIVTLVLMGLVVGIELALLRRRRHQR